MASCGCAGGASEGSRWEAQRTHRMTAPPGSAPEGAHEVSPCVHAPRWGAGRFVPLTGGCGSPGGRTCPPATFIGPAGAKTTLIGSFHSTENSGESWFFVAQQNAAIPKLTTKSLNAKDGKLMAICDLDIPTAKGRAASDFVPNLYASLVLAGSSLFVFNDQDDALIPSPAGNIRNSGATTWAKVTETRPFLTANASICGVGRTCIVHSWPNSRNPKRAG